MKTIYIWVLTIFVFLISNPQTVQAFDGPLKVSSQNSRYFTNNLGKAIVLTGSHTWRNFQSIGSDNFNFENYLSFLKSNGHNFMRLWIWEQSKGPAGFGSNAAVSPLPFVKSGDKYDLSQLNQVFFDRLYQYISKAEGQNIYVSIQLFNGWSVGSKNGSASPFKNHPFNATNNINGVNGDQNGDGQGYEIQTLSNPAVTTIQEAYVKKVIDTVNSFDNVLYEIANETEGNSASVAWQNHFIDFIHNYEATKTKRHPVGFTIPYPNGNNSVLFSSKAEWIAPNEGGGYKDSPPVNTGSKIIISDTDHLWGLGGNRTWAWKSFTRGIMTTYMDCYIEDSAGCPINQNDPERVSLIKNLGYLGNYATKMGLLEMTPQSNLSSTGHVLANTGLEYLVYQPVGGSFTLNLTSGNYSGEWLNPQNGSKTTIAGISGGGTKSFTPPFSGDAVLYLVSSQSQIPGDVDNNGSVNYVDYQIIFTNFGKPYTIYDYNNLVTNFST